jgi:IS5 family transposase
LYEPPVLQRFVGVDLGAAPAPDETTVCRFRHLLEKHDLYVMMQDAVNIHLEAKGIKIATGTIVNATIHMRLLRPRTRTRNATRRCTRPGKSSSDSSV